MPRPSQAPSRPSAKPATCLLAATSSSSFSLSAPAAVNSRIPVCDSVHLLPFSSPALSSPSVHPPLSCVLCCQAPLDQACQPHRTGSFLIVESSAPKTAMAATAVPRENLHRMEIRFNVIHLFMVFNNQICNIYWLKEHVHT